MLCLILIVIIQWVHNFAHATTAELPWHVQNCILIRSLCVAQKQPVILRDLDHELISYLWNGSVHVTSLLSEKYANTVLQ